ncbi:L-type lectin-domain containing receptor kinase SIT2-like [Dioscorea cayenensis subsp. rotundata]|uniref:non-specific serine/threonine protein kinase n=1 Tax=Dioscorea cayennensis subsp. rotundata TaxID=55577 RepID=A0AB40CAX0_DIOCR|nr:L-type lectin-domain containing receptor kinase SIT2-like [Dioscorea cayenensis subsp. rotundata]XP_039137031.1 L-type lectin-domain containing receptor kinase SIT2-like [Dioscorea cayenensis subsp. rotundata]XP_039137032.1 L-type lectin-domain containing receptor kinase SIT2-like [Dioscorea cayenensis subsp. rotundata]
MLLKILIWPFLLNLALSTISDFTYNGFKGANLSLDGMATLNSDGLLRLTNISKHEQGHAFSTIPLQFKRSPMGTVISFSTVFVFSIVPEYPMFGGHGFAFVLSPSMHLFQTLPIYYLGLFNSSNNGNSSNHIFAVEFDTIKDLEMADIDDNHVGIDINSVISNKSASAGFTSDDDGQFKKVKLLSDEPIQVWIEYDGLNMQLNVTLSSLGKPKPKIPLLSSTINLSSIILDHMYVGFSASTGMAYSYHYILGWSFMMNGKVPELDISSLPRLPRAMTSSKDKTGTILMWLLLSLSVLVLMAAAGARMIMVRKNRFSELREDWELDFELHRFSYKQLYNATGGFKDEFLLGVGGFGRVYRGVLPGTEVEVAIKRVCHESRQGVGEFVAEIVSLGQLQHRNLVPLLGYCRSEGELILVYEYMPNRSLDKYLFSEGESTLGWSQRFWIIKGVASGLLYLHEDCERVVIHRDVKASNVLLDGDMNGRLGDFGLARLYDHGGVPLTTHLAGTVGYLAPELSRTYRVTTNSDVFAFGVFLLEVACGRRPIEPEKAEDLQVLIDWVLANWRKGTIKETRDERLGEEYVAEELELVLKLGLLCSHPLPTARPSMRRVIQLLHGDILLPDPLLN